MKNGLKIAIFIVMLAVVVISVSGCASIPIPSAIPLPNEIPVLSWFL